MKEKYNVFDKMKIDGEALTPEEEKERDEENNEKDKLIFELFEKNPIGKLFLEKYLVPCLVKFPILRKGEVHDSYDIGYNQGMLDWIRFIIITTEKMKKK